MIIKRLLRYVGIALCAFAAGIIVQRVWTTRSYTPASTQTQHAEEQWPLTKQIVARSLQSHSFRTDKLRTNSNDEIVWRWLKESIATFPQNWVKLDISDSKTYGVVLTPLTTLEPSQLAFYNRELEKKGLPALDKAKRYQPINVHEGNIICPSWVGLIDVEEAKLVYFEGQSG